MTEDTIQYRRLYEFVHANGVWAKWDAARHLMAAKQMQSAAGTEGFRSSFNELGKSAIEAEGLDRLLAIALLVRISELVKGELRRDAASILTESLRKPIDGIWTLSESRNLPPESKPSEIRENVAVALSQASGPWLVPYVIEALAREDKSSRCRLELCRQLSKREPNVGRWFDMLSDISWVDVRNIEKGGEAARLGEIAGAIATILREQRNLVIVEASAGLSLAKMMQQIAPIVQRNARSSRLVHAALAVISLLDELFSIEFTLIADPEAYAALAVIARWWQSSSYPSAIVDGLKGVVRKLTSAIRLRARLGQKSDELVLRLRQALGGSSLAAAALIQIAETEAALAPEIDDWLRGRERVHSATAEAVESLLSGASTATLAEALAPLLLDSLESNAALAEQPASPLAAHLRRINGRVQALAAELRLKVIGTVGELVEFNPLAHRTVSGAIPSEPSVRLRRPMVVRSRDDGSQDIVERALVAER